MNCPLNPDRVVLRFCASLGAPFENVLDPPVVAEIRHYNRRGHLLDPSLGHDLRAVPAAAVHDQDADFGHVDGAEPEPPSGRHKAGLVGSIPDRILHSKRAKQLFIGVVLNRHASPGAQHRGGYDRIDVHVLKDSSRWDPWAGPGREL